MPGCGKTFAGLVAFLAAFFRTLITEYYIGARYIVSKRARENIPAGLRVKMANGSPL
jgi:hypothetical protein